MANIFGRFSAKQEDSSNLWPGSEIPKKTALSKRRLFFSFLFLVIFAVLIAGFVVFFRQNISKSTPADKLTDINAGDKGSGNKEPLPMLEAENNSAEKYQSENFQINHISFGGDATLEIGDSESLPIEIFSVRTEPFLNEKDNESKIAISWKSNKLTVSEVDYSLAGGGGTGTMKEDDFGFNHNVTIAPLEEGAAYVFSIRSLDRWGNSQSFGYYGAYSSAKADSIFELIGKTFGETFGWAINR